MVHHPTTPPHILHPSTGDRTVVEDRAPITAGPSEEVLCQADLLSMEVKVDLEVKAPHLVVSLDLEVSFTPQVGRESVVAQDRARSVVQE